MEIALNINSMPEGLRIAAESLVRDRYPTAILNWDELPHAECLQSMSLPHHEGAMESLENEIQTFVRKHSSCD